MRLAHPAAPERLFSLANKTAVVTGATGGIGRWIAVSLGAAGAHVVVTGRNETQLAETATLIEATGASWNNVAVDITSDDAPQQIVQAALDETGALDILVNCAGSNQRESIANVTTETFDQLVALNTKAPFFLAQAALGPMQKAGSGSVINIGSLTVVMGIEDSAVYGITKSGLAQLTRSMAVEWARYGVRANCVCPGFIRTPLTAHSWDDPRRRSWMLDRIPLGRPGQPSDLAGVVTLLASDAGAYITGQTLFVDGGLLAGSPWNPTPENTHISAPSAAQESKP